MKLVLPPPTRVFPSKVYLWLCKIKKRCADWDWREDNVLEIDDISADEIFEIA